MEYEIRLIRPDEWRQYRRLRLEALRDTPLAFVEQYEVAVTQSDGFWRDRVVNAAARRAVATFVAVAPDGWFVGKTTCLVEEEITDHRSVMLVGVYVTPTLRGRGVADALFESAVTWSVTEARADRIRLFVLDGNTRAEAFYRRLGFVRTGATMPYPPDPSHTELEMEYRGS